MAEVALRSRRPEAAAAAAATAQALPALLLCPGQLQQPKQQQSGLACEPLGGMVLTCSLHAAAGLVHKQRFGGVDITAETHYHQKCHTPWGNQKI